MVAVLHGADMDGGAAALDSGKATRSRVAMEIVDMAESIIEISEKRGPQQDLEQGKRQGRQEGLKQGEIHGKQEALLKLLQHRFPGVPDAVITRGRSLHSRVELDTLFEKTLTAESLEDIQ